MLAHPSKGTPFNWCLKRVLQKYFSCFFVLYIEMCLIIMIHKIILHMKSKFQLYLKPDLVQTFI